MASAPWLVLQLADSAFPTGTFAHSSGLEAAVAHGEVSDDPSLLRFVEASLWQAGHGALPFVARAHDDRRAVQDLDTLSDAFLVNHVANRASRTQGRSFASTAGRIFESPDVLEVVELVRTRKIRAHLAPLFRATHAALGVDREQTLGLFLHAALRGVLSAAVRMGTVGPYQAQRIQAQAAELLTRVQERCRTLTVREVTQVAPLLELFSGTHDQLYSRLFQS